MLYELKKIRKASGLSQAEAAKEFQTPLGTYRNWEQCINMPKSNAMIKKIANRFDVPMEALFGYDLVEPGTFSGLPENSGDKFRYVPVFATITAGTPDEQDEVLANIPVAMEVMKRHPHAFLFRVTGSSMDRVLPNGCYALVDPDRKDVIENHAYAVKINGDMATVKRLRRLANGFELVPDSNDPTWRTIVLDSESELYHEMSIIGEVVWYVLPFDWDI